MHQNHRLTRPWEHYALSPIWSILQLITARNVKWSVVFDKEVTKQTPSASAEKFTDASMSEGRGHNIPGRQCRYWCLLLATDYSAEDIDSTEDTNYETRQAPPLAASNVQILAAVPCFQTQLCFVLRKTSFVRSTIERVLATNRILRLEQVGKEEPSVCTAAACSSGHSRFYVGNNNRLS